VKPINEKYRQFAKGARLAIDVLQYESAIERAIQYACGNALICDTLKIARNVCFDKNQKVKAVTLDGTVIHKAGMITGGMSDLLSNGAQRWERKVVNELKQRKDRLEHELVTITREKRKIDGTESLNLEIRQLQTETQVAQEELTFVAGKLSELQEQISHVESSLKLSLKVYEKLAQDANSLDLEIQGLEKKIAEIEKNVFGDFCRQLKIASIRDFEDQRLRLHRSADENRVRLASQASRLESE
jgi:structural maintenance of chromosome 1